MFDREKELLPVYPSTPHYNAETDREWIEKGKPYVDMLIEEKLDGANCAMYLDKEGPVIRNRRYILRKGYKKDTKAKDQFKSVWTWFYENESCFEKLAKIGNYSVYGEWLAYTHVVHYDKLPSLFIAYDLYDIDNKRFMGCSDPAFTLDTLYESGFQIPGPGIPHFVINGIFHTSFFSSTDDLEGWIIKGNGRQVKLVRPDFKQIEWLDSPVVKNKIIKV